ncbi:MAG: hypothetical protein ACWA5P_00825 [bacterium]
MKISSIIISLLVINSSFLAGHLSIQLFGGLNPFILGGIEFFLGGLYMAHRTIKSVRNVFDVDVTL